MSGPAGIGGQTCVHYDSSVPVPTECASDTSSDACIAACLDAAGEANTGMALKDCAGENIVGVGILMPTIAGTAYRPLANKTDDGDVSSLGVVVIIVIVCVAAVAFIAGWLVLKKRGKTTVQSISASGDKP